MKKILVLLGTLVIVGLFGLTIVNGKKSTISPSGKLKVATSFYPLYYFASQIGGNKVVVQNITPSGAEPHDYDPSTRDMATIEKGSMLILNGGVESWGDKIKANLKGTNVLVVTAGEGLLTQTVMEEGKNQIDPHVWLDPQSAKKEVNAILQGYLKVDPKNRDYYYANANALLAQLDSLDAAYAKGLATCQKKDIITSHAAFGYLATRYHLTQVPIAGLSPDAEPSAQQLADVVQFAQANHITYIFFESLISPKLSQTIATEIGARTMVLDPIEGVADTDMKAGKNYYTIMQDNLKALQTALQCTQ